MKNVIIILIIAAIAASVIYYLYRQKKKGAKCIGCPYAKECGGKCNKD